MHTSLHSHARAAASPNSRGVRLLLPVHRRLGAAYAKRGVFPPLRRPAVVPTQVMYMQVVTVSGQRSEPLLVPVKVEPIPDTLRVVRHYLSLRSVRSSSFTLSVFVFVL